MVGIAHRQWLQKTSNFDWLRTSNTDCLLVFVWIHSSRPASLVYIDEGPAYSKFRVAKVGLSGHATLIALRVNGINGKVINSH